MADEIKKEDIKGYSAPVRLALYLSFIDLDALNDEQRAYIAKKLQKYGYPEAGAPITEPEAFKANVDAYVKRYHPMYFSALGYAEDLWNGVVTEITEDQSIDAFFEQLSGVDKETEEEIETSHDPQIAFESEINPDTGAFEDSNDPHSIKNVKVVWTDLADVATVQRISDRTKIPFNKLIASLKHSAEEINTVHPKMRAAVVLGIRQLFSEGFPVEVLEGYRPSRRQAGLVANGASRAGPGDSFHNHSLAVDVVPLIGSGPGGRVTRQDWERINAALDGKYEKVTSDGVVEAEGKYGLSPIYDDKKPKGSNGRYWDPAHHQIFPSISKVKKMDVTKVPGGPAEGIRFIPDEKIPQKIKDATTQWQRELRQREGAYGEIDADAEASTSTPISPGQNAGPNGTFPPEPPTTKVIQPKSAVEKPGSGRINPQ